jgi:hypothetical protein
LEDLEDASNELMLSDEENIRYVIGGCFVSLEKDEAETTLQVNKGGVAMTCNALHSVESSHLLDISISAEVPGANSTAPSTPGASSRTVGRAPA